MGLYSLAHRTTSGTDATPAFELRTTATNACRVMRIGFSLVDATASIYGLGRPAARGVNPTSPLTALADKADEPASDVTGAVAWTTTAPTVPAQFLRRVGLPATAGVQFVWSFEHGLYLAVSSSIVLWNLGTNSVVDLWVEIDRNV